MNTYFDTSSWNHLADRTDREELIRLIQHRKHRVLASVISLGEVLRITDVPRRQRICSTMGVLHGDGPLLERPLDLLRAAAEAIRQGQVSFLFPRTGPGDYLLNCMLNLTQPPPSDEIWSWLRNMGKNLEKFKAQLNQLDLRPDLDALPDVVGSEAIRKLLCKLPLSQELGVSLSEMRSICGKSDVWKAMEATLAYLIKPFTTHAPKNTKGGKRSPGAPDLWQAVYLGIVEVFVTDDEPMRDVVSEISRVALFRHPRSTERSDSFFEHLLLAGK